VVAALAHLQLTVLQAVQAAPVASHIINFKIIELLEPAEITSFI
jgi:hypothetical protein